MLATRHIAAAVLPFTAARSINEWIFFHGANVSKKLLRCQGRILSFFLFGVINSFLRDCQASTKSFFATVSGSSFPSRTSGGSLRPGDREGTSGARSLSEIRRDGGSTEDHHDSRSTGRVDEEFSFYELQRPTPFFRTGEVRRENQCLSLWVLLFHGSRFGVKHNFR